MAIFQSRTDLYKWITTVIRDFLVFVTLFRVLIHFVYYLSFFYYQKGNVFCLQV